MAYKHKTAFDQGRGAFQLGIERTDNPYRRLLQRGRHAAWNDGWDESLTESFGAKLDEKQRSRYVDPY